MKKILALILVICLSVGCFVACGDEEADTKKKSTKKPKATSTSTVDPSAGTDATDEGTEPTDEGTEPTDDVTEPTDDVTEPTDDVTEPTPSDDNGSEDDNTGSDIVVEDCLVFDFRYGTDTALIDGTDGYYYLITGLGSANQVTLEAVEGDPGYLSADLAGEDPYAYLYGMLAYGEDFDLQDYPFIKIVMRNGSAGDAMSFFLFEEGGSITAPEHGFVAAGGISSNDTEFKTYILDLRASGASNTLSVESFFDLATKHVSAMRLDFVNAEEGTVDIQYIGFFKTAEEAKAFN